MTKDPGGPTVVAMPQKNDLQASIEQFRRAMPQMIEHAQLIAKVRRASYLALLAEGFSEVQALELCK